MQHQDEFVPLYVLGIRAARKNSRTYVQLPHYEAELGKRQNIIPSSPFTLLPLLIKYSSFDM